MVNGFGDLNPTITLKIGFTRRFRFRLWLGLKIMTLGAYISGLGFEVEE